jgi:hypothetical protein
METIDGITFTIIGFPPPYEGRPIVVYTSTSNGITNTYCAYKSLTEGLWRFAARGIYIEGMEPDQLIKGKHYITSTQLHIRLQELINRHYKGIITTPDYNYSRILVIKEERRSEIEELLYGSGREYDRKGVFSPLNTLCSPENDHCLGTFDKVERTLQTKINGHCTSIINGLARCVGYNSYFTTFRRILSEKPHITNIDELINVINLYMKNYFDILSPSVTIFDTTITDPNTGAVIPLTINCIKIKNKDSGEVFDVYTGTYKYNGRDYQIILNVVPTTAKINKYGLFSTYVSSGIYTYKMFDNIDGRYQFIGERLTRLWPLSSSKVLNVHAPVAAPTVAASSVLKRRARSGSVAGGRRCRRKSRRLSRKRR